MLAESWEGMGYMLILLVLCVPAFMVWSWWDDWSNERVRERWRQEEERQRALQDDDL